MDLLVLLLRQRRCRNKEIDLTPFEVGVRRKDENSTNNPLGAWLAQDMVGIGLEDLTGGDRAAELIDMAVQMDNPDHV